LVNAQHGDGVPLGAEALDRVPSGRGTPFTSHQQSGKKVEQSAFGAAHETCVGKRKGLLSAARRVAKANISAKPRLYCVRDANRRPCVS
jgi:hypothetical protein